MIVADRFFLLVSICLFDLKRLKNYFTDQRTTKKEKKREKKYVDKIHSMIGSIFLKHFRKEKKKRMSM